MINAVTVLLNYPFVFRTNSADGFSARVLASVSPFRRKGLFWHGLKPWKFDVEKQHEELQTQNTVYSNNTSNCITKTESWPAECLLQLLKAHIALLFKFEPHFSFVMLNYFRTNQYEEP